MRPAPVLAPLLLCVLAMTPASAADAGAPLLCATATAPRGASVRTTLDATDRFGTRTLQIAGPSRVCGVSTAAAGAWAGFVARARPRKAGRPGITVDVVDRFGAVSLRAKALDLVLAPAAQRTSRADVVLGARTCYRVDAPKPRGARPRIVVADGQVERVLEVGRPTRLCLATEPTVAADLVCRRVRLARTKPLAQPPLRPTRLSLATWLGERDVQVAPAHELCVPAIAPAPRTFTLAVAPTSASAIAGERVRFTATARYDDDGSTVDVTGTVAWSSSDEGVARVVSASAGGAFVEGVGPGSATIAVLDPITGTASGDAGSATLTVTWPLESLTIAPHAVAKRPGDFETYTVTGHFTGGFTRNLTQRVVYASSDPSVAVATNQPGNRSRVDAVATGDAVVSATDPISGISTTDAGNDATLHVTGALAYIALSSNLRYSSRFPGESQPFTALGYFYGGSILNVTQQCAWASSDPAVATAPNTPGDRSRIEAVAPGLTFVTCTDDASGVRSSPTPFWVLGALTGIEAYGASSPADWLRNGESLRATAVGTYAGGGQRNLTQEVAWTSLDPTIAATPNAPGDRSRIVGLQAGDARVVATDPATGIASPEMLVTVLGELVGLEVVTRSSGEVVPVGTDRFYRVRALYQHGARLLRWDDPSYVLESSDPAVLEVVDGRFVRGVAAGTATLVARDVATGTASAGVVVTVRGDLDSIALEPASVVRGIGEWETFTAIGHFPPSFTELLTQHLVYTSSDESVAVADNAPPSRSRVRTVGAGTATITATDPLTGVSGTATMLVLPGTIDRVTIQPASVVRNPGNAFSYTAIGHYPDGLTINVTQIVTWSSTVPDVAQATNESGNRSRVVAGMPGTATIVARHPSGVSSHDTGDDATFTTKALKAVMLAPNPYAGFVGARIRYTFVGVFTDDTQINLTQGAYYFTGSSDVAQAENGDGDRSAVRLLAPGETTVHAVAGIWSDGLFSSPVGAPTASASLLVQP